jgi:hypothetical protein
MLAQPLSATLWLPVAETDDPTEGVSHLSKGMSDILYCFCFLLVHLSPAGNVPYRTNELNELRLEMHPSTLHHVELCVANG